ncbi:MAG: RNA polymerase sigma factor, partial [Myxococcota bacterium]
MSGEEVGGLTDAALLARCAGGARGACGDFVARHRDAVWRYCRVLVGDPVVAEDVLQDTFLAALRGAGGFAGED